MQRIFNFRKLETVSKDLVTAQNKMTMKKTFFVDKIMSFLLKAGGIYSNHGALTTTYVADTERGTVCELGGHKLLLRTASDLTSAPRDLDSSPVW
jgi:hypothetical protein